MTEEAMHNLKQRREYIRQARETVRKERKKLNENFDIIEKELADKTYSLEQECDHILPNGKHADDGGFMYGCCLICGLDFG